MFVFKAGNKDKSSKAHCDFDQPDSSKQSIYSRTPTKNVFFAQTLLPLFFMSGYAAANMAGSYNGTLPASSGDASGTVISCSDLKNSNVRNQCKDFISANEGKYTVRYLPKGQPIKSHESFTVYILPPGDIPFDGTVKITDAQNIAFIGDSDADGTRPTLREPKNLFMFRFENCQNCMLANVNIDPNYEPAYVIPFQVLGDKSEIDLMNINVAHFSSGLLFASGAKSIILDNFGTTYDHETKGSGSTEFVNSAISLYNCDKIKAKNIRLHEVSLSSSRYSQQFIGIINPVNVEFEDISIGLSKYQNPAKDAAYIKIAFDNSDKYSQPGGRKVNAVMKGLHFGVYTGKGSGRPITVPEDWPQSWHVLSLSKTPGAAIDTTKVNGKIVIENNDDLHAMTSQTGVQPVTGEDLFYNLKVTFTDRINPTLNLSTPIPNSTSIYNLTHAPHPLGQTDDDSGYNPWEKLGIGLGAVAGVAAIVAAGIIGYKYRAVLVALIGSSSVRHYQKTDDDEAFAEDDSLLEAPFVIPYDPYNN